MSTTTYRISSTVWMPYICTHTRLHCGFQHSVHHIDFIFDVLLSATESEIHTVKQHGFAWECMWNLFYMIKMYQKQKLDGNEYGTSEWCVYVCHLVPECVLFSSVRLFHADLPLIRWALFIASLRTGDEFFELAKLRLQIHIFNFITVI